MCTTQKRVDIRKKKWGGEETLAYTRTLHLTHATELLENANVHYMPHSGTENPYHTHTTNSHDAHVYNEELSEKKRGGERLTMRFHARASCISHTQLNC